MHPRWQHTSAYEHRYSTAIATREACRDALSLCRRQLMFSSIESRLAEYSITVHQCSRIVDVTLYRYRYEYSNYSRTQNTMIYARVYAILFPLSLMQACKSECHAQQLFPLSLQGDIENAQCNKKGRVRGRLLLPH
jgi:hypothetical protein